MIQAHEEFIAEQAKTETGLRWLEVLLKIVEDLYSSKDKSMEQVQVDQKVAKTIEGEIISRLLVHNQSPKPERNNEYR